VPAQRPLSELEAADFRAVQGSTFRVTAAGAAPGAEGPSPSFEARLAEVSGHAENLPGEFRAPFALIFHGPPEPVRPQGIYRVEHDQLGTLELFLVPVGPDAPAEPGREPAAMRYEAVFG
jgi:hypothetical protein